MGSLDKHGNISSFSNIAANGDNAIYILGENIISFKPTHMLVPPMAWAKNYLCLLNEINQGNESYKSIADFLMFTNKEHVESDGTSPATAKVAHLAAEFMVDEGLEPQETINKLLEMSAVTETNGIKFHKLILNE